jgi:hypothetical protein
MDPVYQTAFCPPAPEVLRRRLRPLSLGHLVLLESIESPFVAIAAREPTPGDLAGAVYICERSAGELRGAADGEADLRKMVGWGLECKGLVWQEECARFAAYLRDSLRMPEMWQDEGSRSPVAAWQFSVAAALIGAGLSREEAWEIPVAEALALWAAISERNGAHLVSPEEQAMIDEIEAKAAAKSAEVTP